MTDTVLILTLAFSFGTLGGAAVVGYVATKRIDQLTADNNGLRKLIFPFDRDGDGKPGGSKPTNKGA